jgi:hypothetical protein
MGSQTERHDVSPKITFVGVTESHDVPNVRAAAKAGILVVAVENKRTMCLLTAASGNLADLKLMNPIGFGRSSAGWHYNGRSLRELPKSSFTLVVDDKSGDALMPGLSVEVRNFPHGQSNWFTRAINVLRGLRNR